MAVLPQSKIVIGWDVRGWMSKEQAVAVLALLGDRIEWLGFSERFKFSQAEALTLSSLLSPAFEGHIPSTLFDRTEIVLAIDAPLAFSSDFRALVNGESRLIKPPESEIDNPLAYRACERWIKEQFRKKPLSASFDKLGNNASLAITYARWLRSEGFSLVPQDGKPSTREIIEVYPGLTKTGIGRSHPAIPPIAGKIPTQFEPGTDIYDAAICALLGAAYSGWGRGLNIPELVPPADGIDMAEGWIFCLPPDYVRTFHVGQEG